MGSVQAAVLEFDEEVQAPWRPRLVSDERIGGVAVRPPRPHPSRRSGSRVGACRPGELPAVPGRRRPPASRAARVSPPPRSSGVPAARRPIPGRVVGSRLRLTRRARRLAVVLVLAGGVALGSWLGPLLAGGGGGDLRLAGVTSVVVQPGDTLWSIAASLEGGGDVRAVVDEIQQLNGLDDAVLVPGRTLLLP
ncbi:LysM peptidoglycan-binding domain-containing protein [Blastococcus sp. CT_GayMR20]|uniref:LysM peptidoglycan-binding domain-containing protein n=1 Tax=Blastococcus sp. CT_GayMR20 TaxID=2559609 RepID=UPI0010748AB7|nr:LysM peptidoglycan-binding domain-containing protein [Blastococcus sp. CT_GayMR20]TFV86065.1 LysM peptidoglycan-binding domain-containing protein [Blastococcus sp. CT_GayMR20]